MDNYDRLILEIIQNYRDEEEVKGRIKLSKLERVYWRTIESDKSLSVGNGRIGERITNLYLNGYIENKSGYFLTKKGKLHMNQYLIETE